jgi:hypothetical protein
LKNEYNQNRPHQTLGYVSYTEQAPIKELQNSVVHLKDFSKFDEITQN